MTIGDFKNTYSFPIYHSTPKGTFSLLSVESSIKEVNVTKDHISLVVAIMATHALESHKKAVVSAHFSSEIKSLVPVDSFKKIINVSYVFPFTSKMNPPDLLEMACAAEIQSPSFLKTSHPDQIKVECKVVLHIFYRLFKDYYSKEDSDAMRTLSSLRTAKMIEFKDEPIYCVLNLNNPKDRQDFSIQSRFDKTPWKHLSTFCVLTSLL